MSKGEGKKGGEGQREKETPLRAGSPKTQGSIPGP